MSTSNFSFIPVWYDDLMFNMELKLPGDADPIPRELWESEDYELIGILLQGGTDGWDKWVEAHKQRPGSAVDLERPVKESDIAWLRASGFLAAAQTLETNFVVV